MSDSIETKIEDTMQDVQNFSKCTLPSKELKMEVEKQTDKENKNNNSVETMSKPKQKAQSKSQKKEQKRLLPTQQNCTKIYGNSEGKESNQKLSRKRRQRNNIRAKMQLMKETIESLKNGASSGRLSCGHSLPKHCYSCNISKESQLAREGNLQSPSYRSAALLVLLVVFCASALIENVRHELC